jgi:hypothetical protein
MQRRYSQIKENEYKDYKPEMRHLLYQLVIFHSLISERRNYGSIGWNKFYDWIDSDF